MDTYDSKTPNDSLAEMTFGGQITAQKAKDKSQYTVGYQQGRTSAALDIQKEKMDAQQQLMQVQALQQKAVEEHNQQEAQRLEQVKQQLMQVIQKVAQSHVASQLQQRMNDPDMIRQSLAGRMGMSGQAPQTAMPQQGEQNTAPPV